MDNVTDSGNTLYSLRDSFLVTLQEKDIDKMAQCIDSHYDAFLDYGD